MAVAPLTLTLLLAACAPAQVARTPAPAEGTVVLAIGAPRLAPGTDLTVAFEAVEGDSRCPARTQCVWAGDAAVKIRMTAPTVAAATATLHTNLDKADETVFAGWRIQLVAVTPAPTATAGIRPEDYRVTLLIVRK